MRAVIRLEALLVLLVTAACNTAPYEVEISTHASALHPIQITRFRLEIPGPAGGGIQSLGSGYLAATGGGDMYWFERTAPDEIDMRKLPHRIPINRDAFLHYAAEHEDELRSYFSDSFRVSDLLLLTDDDRVTLITSYTYWHDTKACYSLRVSRVTAPPEALLDASQPLDWKLFFDSEPCLPLKEAGHGFAGQQAGGEMALSPDGTRLVLSVGDFEFDGLNDPRVVSQDQNSPYGKLLSIDLETGTVEMVAWGVRNAQGVAFDAIGRIWTTEHGPQGGDELNRIVSGENYGWPYVTYGTQYGRFDWPLSRRQSEHEGFAAPIFSWVPSVGASDLLIMDGRGFSQWRGDLIVSALKPRDLLRVRVRNDRVAYVEPIPVDTRTRDMIEDPAGAIVLWTDNPDLRFLEVVGEGTSSNLTREARGALLYAQCRGCHPISENEAGGIGPNLFGIVGKKVASASGYAYSKALREKRGRWGPNRLEAYLADPQSFAPGTTMDYPGLASAADRESIVAFLASQSR